MTPARTILIQNYHPSATRGLIRDFRRIGFDVYSPDDNWGRISYFAPNDKLGGTLISHDEYFRLPPGFVLITCRPQENDLKAIAREHCDHTILNVAQHGDVYPCDPNTIVICPDIITYALYPDHLQHRLLYFMKPELSAAPVKELHESFIRKNVRTYVSLPQAWAQGYPAYQEFKEKYPHQCQSYGHEAPDGLLRHDDCAYYMASSFFTAHFKDDEAYGLSCLESMLLGTPILSLNRLMHDKTLGRFFLDDTNSILTDSVDEAISEVLSLSFERYKEMSFNARKRVKDLTSDENTVAKLLNAFNNVYGSSFLSNYQALPDAVPRQAEPLVS